MTPTGRLNVQLRAKPLQFDSGAMVITLVLNGGQRGPDGQDAAASAPSSLVSRTRTVLSSAEGWAVEAPASRRGYGCDMGAQQAEAEVGTRTDHGRTVRDSVERADPRPDLRRGAGPDGRLPTERELAAQLGVSRTTVRQVLDRLEHAGIGAPAPGPDAAAPSSAAAGSTSTSATWRAYPPTCVPRASGPARTWYPRG